jgi:hypothetical protein
MFQQSEPVSVAARMNGANGIVQRETAQLFPPFAIAINCNQAKKIPMHKKVHRDYFLWSG